LLAISVPIEHGHVTSPRYSSLTERAEGRTGGG
jgi:hypothetical protein